MAFASKPLVTPHKCLGNLISLGHKIILWTKIMITFLAFLLVAICVIAYVGFTTIFFATTRVIHKMRSPCSYPKIYLARV